MSGELHVSLSLRQFEAVQEVVNAILFVLLDKYPDATLLYTCIALAIERLPRHSLQPSSLITSPPPWAH